MPELPSALEEHGYIVIDDVLPAQAIRRAEQALDAEGFEGAGARHLLSRVWCRELAEALKSDRRIATCLPAGAVAVQCTAFTKTSSHNWLVPLHQDLHIPVASRVDQPELRGWSRKNDGVYVQAPLPVLQALVAVRIHLDDCGLDNGPLRVVPGSHRHGVLDQEGSRALRLTVGETSCVAMRGAALLLKPLLLHASSKAIRPHGRRVLHFLFGPRDLPLGLSWANSV